MKDSLIVHSVFKSISGEVGLIPQGAPTVFIRLAGCNLRCSYCDTACTQPKKSGSEFTIEQIISGVKKLKCKNILITGGEPLMQRKGIISFLKQLRLEVGYTIQIETNGSYHIKEVEGLINCFVVDYKFESGEKYKEDFQKKIIDNWKIFDWLKFVISNYEDYKQAKKLIKGWRCEGNNMNIAFSAVNGFGMTSRELAKLIVRDNVPAVLNVQVHKLIGMD